MFSNSGLTPQGNQSVHNHLINHSWHEQHPQRIPDFMDIFSKSKASKLAEHQPYDLKSPWRRHFSCPSVLSTPCPRRSLQLCISSLMRTFPPGSSILHTHLMEPQFSLSIKKTAHYGFALILEDSIRFPKKRPTSAPTHLWPLRHTTMGMSLYQDQPPTCIPSCPSCSQRQMENHVQNLTPLFQVVGNAWRLTSAPTAFNDLWMIADMIDLTVIIYLDNILIYSDNMSEHKAHVQEVLWRLHTNRLFAWANNCKFTSPLQIPQIYAVAQRPHHDPIQSPDYPGLAWAQMSKPFKTLPQLCQLLPTFHLWIFWNHHTTHTPNLKG